MLFVNKKCSIVLLFSVVLTRASAAAAAFNIGRNPFQANKVSTTSSINDELEERLISLFKKENRKRLSNDEDIIILIKELEAAKSIPRPAIAEEVEGRWRLLHTSNANTSSPIQRSAVDASKYKIYQDIFVREVDDQLIVSQVVQFSDEFELKVDALASTSARPLKELTERKGDGKILGVNVLGVSLVGDEAKEDENRPDSRIDFVFDEGNFNLLGGKFKLPYPVPFRLPILRDSVKGWIDITYLSKKMRIARGNKGTKFVLIKEDLMI